MFRSRGRARRPSPVSRSPAARHRRPLRSAAAVGSLAAGATLDLADSVVVGNTAPRTAAASQTPGRCACLARLYPATEPKASRPPAGPAVSMPRGRPSSATRRSAATPRAPLPAACSRLRRARSRERDSGVQHGPVVGGIARRSAAAAPDTTIDNTIVARNTGGACGGAVARISAGRETTTSSTTRRARSTHRATAENVDPPARPARRTTAGRHRRMRSVRQPSRRRGQSGRRAPRRTNAAWPAEERHMRHRRVRVRPADPDAAQPTAARTSSRPRSCTRRSTPSRPGARSGSSGPARGGSGSSPTTARSSRSGRPSTHSRVA